MSKQLLNIENLKNCKYANIAIFKNGVLYDLILNSIDGIYPFLMIGSDEIYEAKDMYKYIIQDDPNATYIMCNAEDIYLPK